VVKSLIIISTNKGSMDKPTSMGLEPCPWPICFSPPGTAPAFCPLSSGEGLSDPEVAGAAGGRGARVLGDGGVAFVVSIVVLVVVLMVVVAGGLVVLGLPAWGRTGLIA